jgi:hypothetical protein
MIEVISMLKRDEWRFWTADQIVERLPELIDTVLSRLPELPEEHREKNQAALESLGAQVPTVAEIRDASRSRELVTLGFALDVLGRRTAGHGDVDGSLALFQAAHEMFRGGNALLRATRPMRQTLGNALKVLVLHEAGRAAHGESSAAEIREGAQVFVTSAWGVAPPQLLLGVNELLLSELERVRAASDGDPALHERLVRDNIECVLALEIPTRLEPLRRRWEEVGERVAPAAVRKAQRAVRRPEALSALLGPAIWDAIRQAVERGDGEALGHTLGDVEDELEMNLRLRLDAKAEYREPISELRLTGGPDPAFAEARGLLLRQEPQALELFNNLHYRRSSNTIAKEWYAYALTVFGRATDIHDVIELLEDAVASPHFRPDRGWTARWNLACALRRLPSRAGEALDVLLPVLENDAHTGEVFELCLLWSLEQNRQDALPALLVRSRHHEAHLLAARHDIAERRERTAPPAGLRDHFRRINRILRDPDRVFPDPKERLSFDELDQLTRDFIESSLVHAGIEWFRQRVSYGSEGRVFKNWESAAALNDAAGDRAAAWRCRRESWRSTQLKKNVDPRKKTQVLRALLAWAQRNGFEEDALRVLRQAWRDTSMSDADARIWEQRLLREAPDGEPRAAGAGSIGGGPDPAPRGPDQPSDGHRARAAEAAPRREPTRARDIHGAPRPLVGLMLDWENIKISLAELLDAGLPDTSERLRPRLAGAPLAARLLDAAWRHGTPRERWAVADWDRPFFEGDQRALRMARYSADIAGREKFNSSDHVLREKIHLVLREHPEIDTFVIATGDGDFHETIRTLREKGKRVVLWATRRSIAEVYGESLDGPDRIQIEWLEDLVFGEGALA